MSAMYFWDGEKVITIPRPLTIADAKKENVLNMPCVDAFVTDPYGRYGQFSPRSDYYQSEWEHARPESFPPEFRVHLLLLGVS